MSTYARYANKNDSEILGETHSESLIFGGKENEKG